MRESTVETHLRREVAKAGGTTYKFKSPSHKNVPDRIVIWPSTVNGVASYPMIQINFIECKAKIHFIECKAPRKKANPGQAREHVRLQKLGCVVMVLDTKEKIDYYVARNR